MDVFKASCHQPLHDIIFSPANLRPHADIFIIRRIKQPFKIRFGIEPGYQMVKMPLHHLLKHGPMTDIAKACQKSPCLFQIHRKSSRNILRIGHRLQRQIRNNVIKKLPLKGQPLRQIVHHTESHLTITIRLDGLLLSRHRKNLRLRKHLPKLRQIIKAFHHQNPIRHTTCLQKFQKFRLYLLRHRNPPSVKHSPKILINIISYSAYFYPVYQFFLVVYMDFVPYI